MKLIGLYIYIVRKNIIKNYVLNERSLVIFLVIEALDVAECHSKELCGLLRILVVTLNEYNAVVLCAGVDKSVGISVDYC